MILPPPRSTLFPYTTLFRSLLFPRLVRTDQGGEGQGRRLRYRFLAGGHRRIGRSQETRGGRQGLWPVPQQDRKSTRLNSSHSQISYAVFCLKKKKKKKKQYV